MFLLFIISVYLRWSGGRKSEVESADESEQFVELLLKQISQFNQLTSQLSTGTYINQK